MTATITHMRREIEEIPEAVARLLDRSGAALAEAGRGIRERDPHFVVTVARGSSDHAATFMKYAVELTAGLAVASVGPSIASIYGTQAEARRRGLPRHLAIGQEPRHRRHGRGGQGRRRADHRPDQHGRTRRWRAPPTMPSTSWPGRNAASRRRKPSSIPPSPASP